MSMTSNGTTAQPTTIRHVLYFGHFGDDWSTEAYIARALERAGVKVTCRNPDDWTVRDFLRFVDKSKPDVLLLAKADSRFLEAIRDDRPDCGLTAVWVFDLMHESFHEERWTWSSLVAESVDLYFMTDGYTAPRLGNSVVLRQGVPDDVRPGVPQADWLCDAAFVGSVYHKERREFRSVLRRRLRGEFRHFRNVRGPSLSDLAASVKLFIGPEFPSLPNYWSNRIYVLIGHGGCLLTPEIPGMAEEGWVEGEHYVGYRDFDEMLEKAHELIADDDRREKIRTAGQAFALANFTYDHRIASFLRTCEDRIARRRPAGSEAS